MRIFLILTLAGSAYLYAQDKLSLHEAVQLANKQNKSFEASRAAVNVAASTVQEARAGMRPKLDYSESLTRSNNPVFVFGSLLTQHQFTQANFGIYALNRPGFLDNFQSTVTVEQVLFDARRTRNTIRSAEMEENMASEDARRICSQLTFATVKAYLDLVLSREALQITAQAIQSAEADLTRAESIRNAGMSTDADVLSIRVHLARVREQQIRREADLATAKSALNDALGVALDTTYELTTPLARGKVESSHLEDLEKGALANRPEQRRANFATTAASTQVEIARSSLWPKIAVRGVFEADRQQFADRAGANWLGAVSLTWNLFNGGADKARIEGANQSLLQARAERDRLISAVRLEVRRAWEDLRATEQQVAVAQSAVAEAEESLRITQNRYEAGMSTVSDLLRTEVAVLESRTQYLAALHDQHLAAALLELATGTLSADSPAVAE